MKKESQPDATFLAHNYFCDFNLLPHGVADDCIIQENTFAERCPETAEEKWLRTERLIRKLAHTIMEALRSANTPESAINNVLFTLKIGEASEHKAHQTLLTFPEVSHAHIPEKWSDDDYLNSADLIIFLKKNNTYGIERVTVQIKSSSDAIKRERKELKAKEGITDEFLFEVFLRDKALIFIHAGPSATQDSIRESFLEQLTLLTKPLTKKQQKKLLNEKFRVTEARK